jgi:glycosyltransferase involved in cell wall biosynthesis
LKAIYQQKLYRVTGNRLDEYAHLQVVPKRAINWKLIKQQYDQIVKYMIASQSAVAQMALSNALPVITSQAGGLSEAVADNVNGLLFPVDEAKALVHWKLSLLMWKGSSELRLQV